MATIWEAQLGRCGWRAYVAEFTIPAVGIAILFLWFGGTFGFVPLPPTYWISLCLFILSYGVLTIS